MAKLKPLYKQAEILADELTDFFDIITGIDKDASDYFTADEKYKISDVIDLLLEFSQDFGAERFIY